MKIGFICNNCTMERGSYRIHVHDLCQYFNKIDGVYSKINPKNVNDFDAIIYDKNTKIRTKNENVTYKIGIITPSLHEIQRIQIADFIIVGSLEEKCSLQNLNKKIILFPQIESMYQNIPRKIHNFKETIVIGYHGNSVHLNHMKYGLKQALERLSEKHTIVLKIVTTTMDDWVQGKPNVPIKHVKWNIKTIKDEIQSFDIGIVPNISEFQIDKHTNNITLGLYQSDILIRIKNKSNIGRLLTFCQCGIPVVADITPANMHILGNPENGYGVLDEHGWFQAMNELVCYKKRNIISEKAYDEVKRLYCPITWTHRIYKEMQNIYKL